MAPHMSTADKAQLILDFHYCMRQKGKPVANRLDTRFVEDVVWALSQGECTTAAAVCALDNIIRGWHIEKWQQKHYPAMKGVAPRPQPPLAAACELLSDDE